MKKSKKNYKSRNHDESSGRRPTRAKLPEISGPLSAVSVRPLHGMAEVGIGRGNDETGQVKASPFEGEEAKAAATAVLFCLKRFGFRFESDTHDKPNRQHRSRSQTLANPPISVSSRSW